MGSRSFLALVGLVLALSACTRSQPPPQPEAAPTIEQPLKSRLLPGGRYDIMPGREQPGEPFEVETMKVTIEARNNADVELEPQCALWYGSQVVLIDIGGERLAPGERVYLSGKAEFPRPLDDYESGDAGCYTRLHRDVVREMEREERALTMGHPTRVPNLVGLKLDARLPSFRRGLDIRIAGESTPCGIRKLMKMSRYVNAFGRPLCAGPVITTQDPKPETRARVGDVIEVVVSSS